ncbi:MAG: GAF domain-containing protein, partial [Tepidiformaceae bacterium]
MGHNQHLAILRRLVTTCGLPSEADAVLERTLAALTGITGHEISSLHLVCADSRSLGLYGDRGLSAPLREVNKALPIGEGLIGRVALSGQHVRLERVTLSPYLLPAARDVVRAEGIRGFVCVPIRTPRGVLGALSLGRRVRDPFTADDVQLLEVAAGHVAITVEAARRQAETQRQLDALEAAQAGLVGDASPARSPDRGADETVARIADELRTSHRSMLGWVRLLRESVLNVTVSAHGLDVLERHLASQTQRLSDLLDVLHITTGRLPCDRRPIDVVTVLAQAVDRARAAGDPRGAAVDFVTDVATCPVVGDPLRLQQVVLTLVAEALARTRSRSRIVVRLGQEGDLARIAVGGSGPALPRSGAAERRHLELTGSGRIGLAIARHILALHG